MKFSTPLAERQRLAVLHKRRYWSDSEYRLRNINRAREWQGLEPRACVEDIRTRGPSA